MMTQMVGIRCDVCGEVILPTDREAVFASSIPICDCTNDGAAMTKAVCGSCVLNEDIWKLRSA